jgi:hypothetical protein
VREIVACFCAAASGSREGERESLPVICLAAWHACHTYTCGSNYLLLSFRLLLAAAAVVVWIITGHETDLYLKEGRKEKQSRSFSLPEEKKKKKSGLIGAICRPAAFLTDWLTDWLVETCGYQ